MVERMEDEGKIVVIRPQKPVVVDRIERDIQKLTDFYQEGYECAKQYSDYSSIWITYPPLNTTAGCRCCIQSLSLYSPS